MPQAAELRASLREHDASFRIVKNTLTLRAADKAGVEAIKELVAEGPTALTFVRGDAGAGRQGARHVRAARRNVLEVKGGLLERPRSCAGRDSPARAAPEPRPPDAQFAGVVASPLTGLVRGLGSMVSGLAIALGQVRDQKEAEGPPPSRRLEEPAAEEAPRPRSRADEEPQSSRATTEQQEQDEQSEAEKEAE